MDKTRREEFLQSQSIQKFMTQYGMFVTCWSNFEVYLEVLYLRFKELDCSKKIPYLDTCREINVLDFRGKFTMLTDLLRKLGKQDIIDAVDKVVDVANRNTWIHSHVISPDENFKSLTRFRVDRKTKRVQVEPIDIDESPFKMFYEAYGEFEETVLRLSNLNWEMCSMYLDTVRMEQISEDQLQEIQKLHEENKRLRSQAVNFILETFEKARLSESPPEAERLLESLILEAIPELERLLESQVV